MNRGTASLVGCGPGGADWVLPAAHRAVEECDVVFGPSDLQGLFPQARGVRLAIPVRPEAAAPLVESTLARGLSCAVLVRGDCGLRSLAAGIQSRLPTGSCRRIPGVSSVQAACAAFGLDWEKARIVSAHGRDPGTLGPEERAAPLLAVLGGGDGFGRILSSIRSQAGGTRLLIASDLSLPGEKLSVVDAGCEIPVDLPSRTVALLPREERP